MYKESLTMFIKSIEGDVDTNVRHITRERKKRTFQLKEEQIFQHFLVS